MLRLHFSSDGSLPRRERMDLPFTHFNLGFFLQWEKKTFDGGLSRLTVGRINHQCRLLHPSFFVPAVIGALKKLRFLDDVAEISSYDAQSSFFFLPLILQPTTTKRLFFHPKTKKESNFTPPPTLRRRRRWKEEEVAFGMPVICHAILEREGLSPNIPTHTEKEKRRGRKEGNCKNAKKKKSWNIEIPSWKG